MVIGGVTLVRARHMSGKLGRTFDVEMHIDTPNETVLKYVQWAPPTSLLSEGAVICSGAREICMTS